MTHYRLPNDTHTTSVNKYIKEWRAIGDDLAKILDVKVLSFDPGFRVLSNDGGPAVEIPTWLAIKIIKAKR